MFWCDTIKDRQEFCICDGRWKFMKVVNTDIEENVLLFYMTALEGGPCLIFSQRKGEPLSSNIFQEFNFKLFQHVRLEAVGGDIIVAGETYDGVDLHKNTGRFSSECPFSDIEEWRRKERLRVSVTTNTKRNYRDSALTDDAIVDNENLK